MATAFHGATDFVGNQLVGTIAQAKILASALEYPPKGGGAEGSMMYLGAPGEGPSGSILLTPTMPRRHEVTFGPRVV